MRGAQNSGRESRVKSVRIPDSPSPRQREDAIRHGRLARLEAKEIGWMYGMACKKHDLFWFGGDGDYGLETTFRLE